MPYQTLALLRDAALVAPVTLNRPDTLLNPILFRRRCL